MSDAPRRSLKPAAIVAGGLVAAALVAPAAANAAGSLVTISDPSTAAKARVSAAGRLQVDAQTVDQTALLYRTPLGATTIAAGTSTHLANLSTAGYKRLRVVADERTGSATNVSFRMTVLEGSELVGQLRTFTLSPHSETTFTIDLPARAVALYADAAPGSGRDSFDLLVYGQR